MKPTQYILKPVHPKHYTQRGNMLGDKSKITDYYRPTLYNKLQLVTAVSLSAMQLKCFFLQSQSMQC